MMSQLFKEFITPQQKELGAMIEEMGGPAALEKKEAMEKIARKASALTSHRKDYPFNVAELQQEINGSLDEAIKRNAELFDNKFDKQQQIMEDIARAINKEADRIVRAIEVGPHVRIVDPVRCKVFNFRATHTPTIPRISRTSGGKWQVTDVTLP
jgi:hypothetical protein